MIPMSVLLLFLIAALGLLVIPGPAVLYITARGMVYGRKAGLASVFGIELASLCHSFAAAFGVSAILLTSALAFRVVKYLGAAYLVYLGVRTLLSERPILDDEMMTSPDFAHVFRKGFLVNLLNPKVALFFYAFLPQFVDPTHGSPILQILFLGALFVALATVTDTIYALLASHLGALLLRWKPFQGIRRFVTAGIYLALGVGAAVSGSSNE